MKVMTFNIWNYDGNWNKRKSLIISAVKKENPDILFMQEVFDDTRYQKSDGLNQAEQLKAKLNYRNSIYDIIEQIISIHTKFSKLTLYGKLCLTNLPISEHRLMRLKRENDDKHYRAIQIIKVIYQEKEVLFYHVHFSNRNDWSKLHLEETKAYLLKNRKNPIILGDFNILKPDIVKNTLGNNYLSSYEFRKYISYPSKKEVLDYIALPKKYYKFKSLKCGGYDGSSDHRPLIANIELI